MPEKKCNLQRGLAEALVQAWGVELAGTWAGVFKIDIRSEEEMR